MAKRETAGWYMKRIGIRRKFLGLIVCACIGVGGVAAGVRLDRAVFAEISASQVGQNAPGLDYKLINEVWQLIEGKYVDRAAIKPTKLTYGAISGMVNALGDTGHSSFLDPDMVGIESHYLQGNFSGIGAQIQIKNGHVVILAPLEGSPALRAGLKTGDIIMKVDGKDITGLPLEQVVSRIAGKAGTSVTLTILDPKTEESREVTIVRAKITVRNVTWAQVPGTRIADLRIAGFSEGVTKDVRKALRQIEAGGATGIILDMRDNPGGVLGEAISTASQFLSSGTVVLQKDSKGDIKPIKVQPGGLATTIPLVVLINQGTASGSEIVAGALKDANRARLVGEKTFGTGTVLQEFHLSDGSAVLLAIAEWLTPAGHVIWHKGIEPDVKVSLSPKVTPLYPEKEKGMSSALLKASRDAQLLKALEMVNRGSVSR
ncbi:MAG: S41 family peptidase [Syntrophobacteraceae bacterium]|nr:S41 family peptidase [Syntrophobacteraceae bacterium]